MNPQLLALKRWNARRKPVDAPMPALLATAVPATGDRFGDTEFVALDIETTGLDANTAEMVSVGWVIIRNGRVDLGTARSYLVRPSGGVGDSATVHGLTDTICETGDDLGMVLDRIVETLIGRVLVVHFAGLDKALLDRLCRERYGISLLVPVVDTLALARRRLRRADQADGGHSLRLPDLRDAYNLPRYAAHDCLVDAIATAELLLAICQKNFTNRATKLAELWH